MFYGTMLNFCIIAPKTSNTCFNIFGSEATICCLWTCVLNLVARCGYRSKNHGTQFLPKIGGLAVSCSRLYRILVTNCRTTSTRIGNPRRSISSICLTRETGDSNRYRKDGHQPRLRCGREDSQAALQSVLNLSKSHPPRSGVEREIKDLLLQRAGRHRDCLDLQSHRHPRQ